MAALRRAGSAEEARPGRTGPTRQREGRATGRLSACPAAPGLCSSYGGGGAPPVLDPAQVLLFHGWTWGGLGQEAPAQPPSPLRAEETRGQLNRPPPVETLRGGYEHMGGNG